MNDKAAQLGLALSSLLVSAALLLHSFSPEYAGLGDVHSIVFYPRVILYVWVFLSVMLLAQAILRQAPLNPGRNLPALAGSAAMMIVFGLCFEPLGFLVSATLFFLGNALILGYRNLKVLIPVCLAVPWIIWLCFERILQIPLPAFGA